MYYILFNMHTNYFIMIIMIIIHHWLIIGIELLSHILITSR
jgi:hypothetical protein